jgi:hypothetical protein
MDMRFICILPYGYTGGITRLRQLSFTLHGLVMGNGAQLARMGSLPEGAIDGSMRERY